MNIDEKHLPFSGARRLLLLLCVMFGPWNAAPAQEGPFAYRALREMNEDHRSVRGGREEFRFELPSDGGARGKVIYARHIEATVEYCTADSAYFCVWTAWYSFAVPKDFSTTNPNSWTVNGFTFESIRERRTLELLGKVVDDVYTIRTPREASSNGRTSGEPTFSLYSPTIGLIGFKVSGWDDEFYWLTNSYGFGRMQDKEKRGR